MFNYNFKIVFENPSTDVCRFCIRIQTAISNWKDKTEIERLKTSLRVHKVRA